MYQIRIAEIRCDLSIYAEIVWESPEADVVGQVFFPGLEEENCAIQIASFGPPIPEYFSARREQIDIELPPGARLVGVEGGLMMAGESVRDRGLFRIGAPTPRSIGQPFTCSLFAGTIHYKAGEK